MLTNHPFPLNIVSITIFIARNPTPMCHFLIRHSSLRSVRLLLAVSLASLPLQLNAVTHYLGGEISWDCLPNGNYRFVVTLYDDCGQANTAGYPPYLFMSTNGSTGPILLMKSSETDFSLPCNPDPIFNHISCIMSGGSALPANSGAMAVIIYSSDSTYPIGLPLPANIPVEGIYFAVNAGPRNSCNNMAGTSATTLYLVSSLYPDSSGSASPCFESSPRSTAPPQPAFYTQYPSLFYHELSDPDQDRIEVAWENPATGSTGLPFNTYLGNYSANSPLPNKLINPLNQEAVLDPNTGSFTFLSHTPGSFLFCQRVSAYRNGQKISEIRREFQVRVITPVSFNLPPVISINNQLVADSVRVFEVDALPGDMIGFTISSNDIIPPVLQNGDHQTITLLASGEQFGSGFISPATGCTTPPCATLSAVPPISDTAEVGFYFFWPVTPAHILNPDGSWKGSNFVYDFHFQALDNVCPIPGVRNLLCRIRVDLNRLLKVSDEHCLQMDSSGNVNLSWQPPLDSLGSFTHYRILHSENPDGPFNLLDTLGNILDTNFTLSLPSYSDAEGYYRVEASVNPWGMEFPLLVFQSVTPGFSMWDSACPSTFVNIDLEELTSANPIVGWDAPGAVIVDTSALPSFLGLQYDLPGTYPVWVWIQDSCGITCGRRQVHIHQPILPGFIGNRYFCPGHSFSIQATGGQDYIWSTGQTQAQILIPNLTHTIPISVTMTDTQGCHTSATVIIRKMQPFEDENICMVDITQDQHPEIIWEPTQQADIKTYRVEYASYQQPGTWNTLASMSFENGGRVQDSTHDPSVSQYLYRLRVIDSCDAASQPSPVSAYLHLKADVAHGMVMLSWLPYQGLNYNKVFVLRAVSGGQFVLLDSVSVPGINFLDASPPQGTLSYKLQLRDTVCAPDTQSILDVINSNICNVSIIGINENAVTLPANVYYVQGTGTVIVELDAKAPDDVWMEIYSVAGQLLMHYDLKGESQTSISIQGFTPGMYYYSLGTGNRRLGGGRFIKD